MLIKEKRRIGGMAFQPGLRPVLSGRENGDKGYKTGWVDTGEAILTLLSGWENGDKVIKSLDKWNSEAGKRVKTSRKEQAGTSRNRNEREQEPRGKKPAKVKNE
ncbi:hypothetical protein QJQ58_28095 [Paenibacillus dendritiformis]|uniref:hypothetical protein n=1 Tax=Paenibacillus dendritiformis TaxID=130049 RepID=UPI00248B6DE2|nr:hypothetical protein [Paenibacillus dendritiformis]WGU94308.1 hypothetical protein QJQ58_28095 [Paenibacillus dendritiformis]